MWFVVAYCWVVGCYTSVAGGQHDVVHIGGESPARMVVGIPGTWRGATAPRRGQEGGGPPRTYCVGKKRCGLPRYWYSGMALLTVLQYDTRSQSWHIFSVVVTNSYSWSTNVCHNSTMVSVCMPPNSCRL